MTQRKTAVQRLKLGAVVMQAHRLFVTWTTAVVAAPTIMAKTPRGIRRRARPSPWHYPTVSININEAPLLGLSRRQRPRTRAQSAALTVTTVLLAELG